MKTKKQEIMDYLVNNPQETSQSIAARFNTNPAYVREIKLVMEKKSLQDSQAQG